MRHLAGLALGSVTLGGDGVIKDGNKRIAITLDQETARELEWLKKHYGKSKTVTIRNLIHSSYVMLSQNKRYGTK